MSKIKIKYNTENSEEIYRSIKVDNIDLPDGMKINVNKGDNYIEIYIEMEIKSSKDILTLRNTADEILAHIEVIEKVISNVNS
ncbi:hypothetical protein DFR85_09850 [Acidianus brierleyi]|uniref:KEOPS complex Pcc1-like subunit n=1 Tax=Acidianus brierleyi TaxID=41673 RepID=A0A2U9IIX7_9CREN|nr:hypothetical protein DFR85_09850 [Acidianus brierleyi]